MKISGFPKVIILALPMSKKYPVVLLVLAAFLIPVFISSATYVKLIYNRKKIFQNRIDTLAEISLEQIPKLSKT